MKDAKRRGDPPRRRGRASLIFSASLLGRHRTDTVDQTGLAPGTDKRPRGSAPQKKKAPERKFGGFLLYCLFLVGRAGFEPATNGLKVRCSTS